MAVDLTTVADVGTFDLRRGRDRRLHRFLDCFAEMVAAKVAPGDEHIDDVPTQIVTEYLLKIFRDMNGQSLDGSLYSSSTTGEQCVVLDVPNEACVEQGVPVSDDRLQLLSDEASVASRMLGTG